MKLVAILFEEPPFSKLEVINLGSQFTYSLSNGKLSRTGNSLFIKKFYKGKGLSNISAIVGNNGAGKTSLLKNITDYVRNSYGRNYLLIFEKDNGDVLIEDQLSIIVQVEFTFSQFEVEVATIYYSPHIDFREKIGDLDLSHDNIFREDIENLDQNEISYEQTNAVSFLKLKNIFRIVKYLSSGLSKELMSLFNVESDKQYKITFSRPVIIKDKEIIFFDETPRNFRAPIQSLYNKILEEADIIRNNTSDRKKLQKDLMKNYFLNDVLFYLIRLMEEKNTYLEEGFLEIDIFSEPSNSSHEIFIRFLENHFFSVKGETFKLLPVEETKDFLERIYHYIDISSNIEGTEEVTFDWNNKCIYLNDDEVMELLELQEHFVNKLDKYYRSNLSSVGIDHVLKISNLVNFEFAKYPLSSGQNSLLTLFSRFHYSFNNKFSDYLRERNSALCLILLDEADLGFHPLWKKKFVTNIIKFFDSYCDIIEIPIQIIFTTHDPLTLSDILSSNVTYIRNMNNIRTIDKELTTETFGANLSDLLADSFYLGDGLIGELAKERIQEVILWLNESEQTVDIFTTKIKWADSYEDIYNFILQIGEEFLKEKLMDMFLIKCPRFKNSEIEYYKRKLKELEGNNAL